MAKDILVGKVADFKEGDKKIIPNGGSEIGVYHVHGKWLSQESRQCWPWPAFTHVNGDEVEWSTQMKLRKE